MTERFHRIEFLLLLARLMGQCCFAGWCLLTGASAVGWPTLHGGPVRLRPVRTTPCWCSKLMVLSFDTVIKEFARYLASNVSRFVNTDSSLWHAKSLRMLVGSVTMQTETEIKMEVAEGRWRRAVCAQLSVWICLDMRYGCCKGHREECKTGARVRHIPGRKDSVGRTTPLR